MLADFLHAKQLLETTVDEFLKSRVKAYLGPFAGIDERMLVEGNSFGHSQSNGIEKQVELKLISEKAQVDIDKIKADATYTYMWQLFDELAAKMAKLQLEDTFETLKEAKREAGNDIPLNQFTPESVLNMWERIDIGFDENGEPTLPGIFTFNQEMLKKYNDSVEKIKSAPDLRARMDEILRIKRIIWDDRESHRKLVD